MHKSLFGHLTTAKSICIIAILGILVFANSIVNGFVADDASQIVENPYAHSLTYISTIFTGGTYYNGPSRPLAGIYYRPVSSTLFSFIYALFGGIPLPFHVFQIALHILNACIVFFLFSHFFKKSVSLFLSLIFLVHPMNSETVFYISATQDVLFFLFGMTSLWLLVTMKSERHLSLATVGIFLSLFSKETGIVFLLVSALYVLLFHGKKFYQFVGMSAIVFVVYMAVRIHAVGFINSPLNAPIGKVSFSTRLLMMPDMFLFYLRKFLFPIHLASSYHWVHTQVTVNNFYIPLVIDTIIVSILSYFGFILYKKYLHKFFIYTYFLASGW